MRVRQHQMFFLPALELLVTLQDNEQILQSLAPYIEYILVELGKIFHRHHAK